jgi:hypothetical protein
MASALYARSSGVRRLTPRFFTPPNFFDAATAGILTPPVFPAAATATGGFDADSTPPTPAKHICQRKLHFL